MSIKTYYPTYYDGIREFEELAQAEDILLKEIEDEIIQSNLNNFVVTADENTVKAIEHVLKIYDGSKYSLDFRRERIINRKSTKVPFTKITLMQQLDTIMGKGNYKINIDHNNHLLSIEVELKSYEHYIETRKTVNRMKPCTLEFIFTNFISNYINLIDEMRISKNSYIICGTEVVSQNLKNTFIEVK